MKSFIILGSAGGDTKTVLEMIDRLFNCHTYFVSVIPLARVVEDAGVGTKVFLWVNVKHTTARGIGTRAIAGSPALGFAIHRNPFHFRANEFHSWDTTTQMRFAPLAFHRQSFVVRATGDSVLV